MDPSSKATWGTLLQLHGPVGFLNAPPVSIDLIDHFTVSVRGGDADVLGNWHGKIYELKDGGAIRYDQWEDFVLMVKFARDDRGALRLWRRTNGSLTKVFEVAGVPTMVFKPSIESWRWERRRRWPSAAGGGAVPLSQRGQCHDRPVSETKFVRAFDI